MKLLRYILYSTLYAAGFVAIWFVLESIGITIVDWEYWAIIVAALWLLGVCGHQMYSS